MKKHALSCIFIIVVFLALRSSALSLLSTHALGGVTGDGGLYVWLTKVVPDSFTKSSWFSLPFFYPYTKTLAWSDNYIFPSFISLFFQVLGFGFITSYNLALVSAALLTGLVTYLFVYSCTERQMSALFAGVGFLSLNYLSVHLGHPQLQWIFFLPLTGYLSLKLREAPSFLLGFALGCTLFLTFLSAIYYAVFASLLIFAILLPTASSLIDSRRSWIALSGIICALLPATPFVIPYLHVKETFGERALYETFYLSATPYSYLSSSASSPFYHSLLPHLDEEQNLFPGFVALGLFIWAFLVHLREERRSLALTLGIAFPAIFALPLLDGTFSPYTIRIGIALFSWILIICAGVLASSRSIRSTLLFATFFFLFFSFGPLGNPEKKQLALGLSSFLHAFFPGVSGIRAVSRAGIITLLLGFSYVATVLSSRYSKGGALLFSLALPLIVLENTPRSIASAPPIAPPPIVAETDRLVPQGMPLIALPFAAELTADFRIKSWSEYASMTTTYMQWLGTYEHPIVNGYSGISTKLVRELPRALAHFPDKRSIAALLNIPNLSYVVYLSRFSPNFDSKTFEEALYENNVSVLARDGESNYLLQLGRPLPP